MTKSHKIFVILLTIFQLSSSLAVSNIFGMYSDETTSESHLHHRRNDEAGECKTMSSGTGQCMFDLSCRLSYGHKVGDCSGGFYQVCCVLPDNLANYHRQQRLLEYSSSNNINNFNNDQTGQHQSRGQCGVQMTAAKRVVGGDNAQFGQYPWMALIKGSQTQCGGALVGDRWVITAGHCVRDHNNIFSLGYTVILGEHTLLQKSEPLPRQKFTVAQVHMHPLYQQTEQADRFDIAILELDRPVRMMPHIQPVCLPSSDSPLEPGVVTTVSGWGAVSADSSVARPKVLQAAQVITVQSKECEKWHWGNGINVNVHQEMMCAGHREGGVDACQGDSGGPLVAKDDESGAWTLVGVVSAGYSCAQPGQPGIYHRVSSSIGWINHVMTQQL